MGPMPWTINAEIYPVWARGAANGASTFTNWLFNLFSSISFLSLTEAIGAHGEFIADKLYYIYSLYNLFKYINMHYIIFNKNIYIYIVFYMIHVYIFIYIYIIYIFIIHFLVTYT